MDIGSPPTSADSHSGHNHLQLPEFSLSFPLPFRVLFLIGFAILLWASNLHILHLLGLDTATILDFRDPDLPLPSHSPNASLPTTQNGTEEFELADRDESGLSGLSSPGGRGNKLESGKLYGPVYQLFLVYTAWVGMGWIIFRWVTDAQGEDMESLRGIVGFVMLGVAIGIIWPYRGVGERERKGLKRAFKRILFPSLSAPIYFGDVILADILTSFAKVLGDLYVSASQIWNGGITHGRVRQYGLSNWITLSMVCLPYTLRLRQCLIEYHQSSYTSTRPLMNALKYFSAFPVILLSALQKDLNEKMSIEEQESVSRWHGENRIFRLWLFAVVVNSMFSFYWDVQKDWGLRLCEIDTWFPNRSQTSTRPSMNGNGMPGLNRTNSLYIKRSGSPMNRDEGGLGLISKMKGFFRSRSPSNTRTDHQRSPCPTPGYAMNPLQAPNYPLHSHASPSLSAQQPITAFGLRSILLLPDPLVYHLFTIIDFILRFTWSLKLSSHLHTISEIESGVFMMEALELVRRWMWVFIRIEWEAVKMGESKSLSGLNGGENRGLGLGGDGQENGEFLGPPIAGLADGYRPGTGVAMGSSGSRVGPGEVLWDEKSVR